MGIYMSIDLSFIIGLSWSIIVNIILTILCYRYHRTQRRLITQPPQQQSIELQEFLRDLMAGDALIRVERISPEEIFIHNPRGVK